MEKGKELQEKKPTNTRLKLTISIVCLVILSIAELYLMINNSEEYLFLGLVGLAILCFVYLVTDLCFKMRREQELSLEKDFESLYKAQKVSYITVKQGIAKMEELLDELGEELSFPLDEVLQAQKAVGRVTIQKNKENIDAVVESNEKLIEHLQAFEQRFSGLADQIGSMQTASAVPVPEAAVDRQEEILSALARMEGMLQNGPGSVPVPDHQEEILNALEEIGDTMRREFGREPVRDRQQEILDYLARIEASVKNEISELEVHMESKIDEIPSAVQEEQKMSPEDLEKILGETSALMDSMQLDLSGEAVPAEKAEMPEGSAIPELVEQPGETVSAEEPGISEDLAMPELVEQPENLAMPELVEQSGETSLAEDLGISGDLTMSEMIGNTMTAEAFEVPQTFSESEKVMTPEEVASLLGDVSEAETVLEEEKPAMPDLSDPGHVMTPEEIEAMLNNM